MRSVILTFIMAISAFMVARSQQYLENNPRWTYFRTCQYSPPCDEQNTYHHFVNGDTSINGLTYKRVETERKIEWYWMSSMPKDPQCQGYEFYRLEPHFVRQEGQKWFVFENNKDTLLYDFGIPIGSKVPLSRYNSDAAINVVGESSVTINNEERRIIFLQGNGYSATLMEGIGHTRGLFREIYNDVDCGGPLDCYSVGNKRYVKEGSFVESDGTCLSASAIDDISADINYSIYADQNSKTIRVKLSKALEAGKLNVTNLLGQRLYTNASKIDKLTEISIPLSSASGLVIVSFEIGATTKSSKIFFNN